VGAERADLSRQKQLGHRVEASILCGLSALGPHFQVRSVFEGSPRPFGLPLAFSDVPQSASY
jgi:hypothetical protein